MTCPLCARVLAPTTLLPEKNGAPELRGFRCPDRHGVFVPADSYYAWHDNRSPQGVPDLAEIADDLGDAGDVKRAKLCPQDGRIMTRYRVDGEGSFWLDRCGTCGGAWFDGGEWEASVAAGLHEALPRVFSDAWQRALDAEALAASRRDRLRQRVGADDQERIEAFRAWLWAHPHRHLLLARLNERPDTLPNVPGETVPAASQAA